MVDRESEVMMFTVSCLCFFKKLAVSAGKREVVDESKLVQKQKSEEKRLAEMMIPKKNKRLYNKIMFSKKKKAQEVSSASL